jgi:ribonuclease HII
VAPELLLNDAVTIPGVDVKQVPIIKGDAKSISIGAASIVAKVTRDRLMVEYDKLIDRQLERAAITSISGFGRIYDDAVAVLQV